MTCSLIVCYFLRGGMGIGILWVEGNNAVIGFKNYINCLMEWTTLWGKD